MLRRRPGVVFCSAVAVFLASCSKAPIDPGTDEPPVPSKIIVVSGNNQQGPAGKTLGSPIVAVLADRDNKPTGRGRIAFSILSGGGALSDSLVQAANDGQASVFWTLGNGPEYILKATLIDAHPSAAATYLYANSHIIIETKWTANLVFSMDGQRIAHDNRILESNHFLTFSDASTDDIKIIFSKMAEESFAEIKQAFGVQSDAELRAYLSKMTIYTNKNLDIEQAAFPYGFFLYGQDSEVWRLQGNDDFQLRREVKHETMHAFQWVYGLTGIRGYGKPPKWFSEGLSEYISGGYFPPMTTVSDLDEWMYTKGHGNPIDILGAADFPIPYERTWEYYAMFNLAVRYLLEKEGLGKTFLDVRGMYDDMLTTQDFSISFERTMGMSVSYYREHFFEMMRQFLVRTTNSINCARQATTHQATRVRLSHP